METQDKMTYTPGVRSILQLARLKTGEASALTINHRSEKTYEQGGTID
jgi:hypothetical protein